MSTNGHPHPAPPSYEETRQRLREARARIRLAEAQAQLRLLEAYGHGGYGYGPYVHFSGAGPGELDPLAHVAPDRFGWLPLGAHKGSRDKGRDSPYLENETQLFAVQASARHLVRENPLAGGLVDTVVDFVVGEGLLPRVTSREKALPKLIARAQDVLDRFVDDNAFDEFQQELVGRAVTDGEYFTRRHEEDGGRLYLRVCEPEHVCQPPGEDYDDWGWGIHTPKNDPVTPLAYALSYGDPEDWESVDAAEIDHVKRNVVRNVKRGLSDFFGLEEAFWGVWKLLRNQREGEAIRAAIAGFWKYELASAAGVSREIADKRDRYQPLLEHPISGKAPNYQRFDAGMIPHVPKGKEFVPPPASPAYAAQVQAVQATLRSLLVRWAMPEYFSGDASNANYASTLVAGAPFVRRVRRWQAFFRRRFERTYWAALRCAHDVGKLGGKRWTFEELQFLLDIQCEAPAPEIANEREQAQVDWGDMDRGVLSTQTRRQKRGLDDEQEKRNLQEEPPKQPGGGGQGPDQGGPDMPGMPSAGPGGAPPSPFRIVG